MVVPATATPDYRMYANGQKVRLTPDDLAITEFPSDFTNLLRLYNGLSGTYGQMWGRQQNVRSAVGVIAREAAELNLKMYEKIPRPRELPSERLELGEHDAMILLDEPMPGMSTYWFWYALFSDIGIYDIAFWQKIRQNGLPKALLRIPPEKLMPDRDYDTNRIRGWRVLRTGKVIPLDQLVVFWGYDPAVNHGMLSPMETLRRVLAEQFAADMDREGRWAHGLRRDLIIEQDREAQSMTDEARESFLIDAEDALAGSNNSGRPFMLEPGMRARDSTWNPLVMEYLKLRQLNRVEVASAFYIPPAMIAAGDGKVDQGDRDFFYQSSLPPWLSRVEKDIKAQLLPDFTPSARVRRNQYFEFNLDAKLRGSFEMRAQILMATAGGPIVTVNEARGRINLPPVKGGDEIFIPLNLMRAGGPQMSEQNPTQTPATPAGHMEPITTTPGGGSQPQTTDGGPVKYVAMPSTEPLYHPTAEGPDQVLTDDLMIAKAMSPDVTSVDEVMAAHEQKVRDKAEVREQVSFLREHRVRAETRYEKAIDKFFGRQRNARKAKKILKSERWDNELEDDIFSVHYQTVSAVGPRIAETLGTDFDVERTAEYLRGNAKYRARFINDSTRDMLGDGADEESVFGEGRVHLLALSLAAFAVGWSVHEAAHQGGETVTKTWTVTSGNPRPSHEALDGVTIGYGETFDNGLSYPGDPDGDVAEVAGCSCLISVQRTRSES